QSTPWPACRWPRGGTTARCGFGMRRDSCSSSWPSWASRTYFRNDPVTDELLAEVRSNSVQPSNPEVDSMSKVMLLVGTRKGCFLLDSDRDRRDWNVRGPFCEGWPIYHAVYDAEAGTIYAAAASEWHGATVWRSTDLGETWAQSSEGLGYDDLKLSKVSTLAAAHGRVLAGAEAAGI